MVRTLGGSRDGVATVTNETSLDHNESNPHRSSSTRSPAKNEEQKQVELKDEERAAKQEGNTNGDWTEKTANDLKETQTKERYVRRTKK